MQEKKKSLGRGLEALLGAPEPAQRTLKPDEAIHQLAIEKIMTKHSKKEQSKSKLDSCTKEELEEFTKLNNDYKNI